MSHQKMQEMFGQLRQWLHIQTIDRQWLTAFLSFLKEAYATSPDVYLDQWVPYLNQRHDLWRQCLFDAGYVYEKDVERMSLLNQIAPFIQHQLYLSEYISPDDVYQERLKALEQEVGEVHDFLFELDDLVPAIFGVVRQATLLWYSVSFSESAQLGSAQSGYTVLDWEFAGPQAIFDVFIRGTFPNLRRLEFHDDYGRYVDMTSLFDAMIKHPERFPLLEYVDIRYDWLPLEHKALTCLKGLSMSAQHSSVQAFQKADFSTITSLTFSTLEKDRALALVENKTLNGLKSLIVESGPLPHAFHEQLTQNPQFKTLERVELDFGWYESRDDEVISHWLSSPNHQQIKHLYVFDEPSYQLVEESGLDDKMHPRVDAPRPIWLTHTPALHLFNVNPALFLGAIQKTSLRFELEGLHIEGPSARMLSDVAALSWFEHLEHFGTRLQSWDMDDVDVLIAQLGEHSRDWQTMLFSTEDPLTSDQLRQLLSQHTSSLKKLAIHHSSTQDLQWIATQCTSLDYLELRALSEQDARIIVRELSHLKGLSIQPLYSIESEVLGLLNQNVLIQNALRAGGSGHLCQYTSP